MSMNAGITNVVRPQTLDDIVGMETNKRIIHYAVQGAKNRNEPFPSYILGGPGGTGKSTLAAIIVKETGGKLHKIMGSDLAKIEDLYLLVQECSDGDCVYIDEAHLIAGGKNGKIVQNHLYMLIEDHDLPGASAFGITKIPKIYFCMATTDPGRLTAPLRSRCKRLDVGYYSVEELATIILRAAQKMGHDFSTDKDALRLLAQSSRGMPRIAILQRLDPLLNVMSVDNLPFSLASVQHYLKVMEINEHGLEPNDVKYCQVLKETSQANGGNPVAFKTLQHSLGCSDNLIQDVIEAYLFQVGFITISTRGRSLTKKGYRALGWDKTETFPETSSDQAEVDKVHNDTEEIIPGNDEKIFDPVQLKSIIEGGGDQLGVVKLMKSLGGRYHNIKERRQFLDALAVAGFDCKRGRGQGIVPKTV